MTTRRSFLLGATALLAAPAVVRASSLMKLWVPPEPELFTAASLERVMLSLPPSSVMFMQNRVFFVSSGPQLLRWSAAEDHTNWSVA